MGQLEHRILSDNAQAHLDDTNRMYDKHNYVFDVKDFGAVGDGVTLDHVAILAATDAASAAGGGIVYYPPGTYLVAKQDGESYTVLCPSDVEHVGAGRDLSILKADVSTGDWYRMFDLEAGVSNIKFRHLGMDGNESNVGGVGQHSFGIRAESASDIVIEDCHFYGQAGDGVYYYNDVFRTRIESCRFDLQRRNCFTFGGGASHHIIVNNHMTKDQNIQGGGQALDSEPNGGGTYGGVTDVLVQGNILEIINGSATSLTTVGAGVGKENLRWVVDSNIIIGAVGVNNSVGTILSNNYIDGQENIWAIKAYRDTADLIIDGNHIITRHDDVGDDAAIYINMSSELYPLRPIVTNNTIICEGDTKGIWLQSCQHATITNNNIRGNGTGMGIFARAYRDTEGLMITGNKVMNFQTGIRTFSSDGAYSFDGLTITGNYIGDDQAVPTMAYGVEFSNLVTTYPTVIFNDNTFQDTITSIPIYDHTSGTTELTFTTKLGEVEILTGNDDPEGYVTADEGAAYLFPGGGTGRTLLVKESGAGNTGWVGVGSHVFNVLDYGATGDGTTDDSAAIQDAIDAAEAVTPQGTVYFPNLIYKIDSGLTILDCNVRAEGDAQLLVDDTVPIGLTIGSASTSCDTKTLELPGLIRESYDWDSTPTIGTSRGVLIKAADGCTFTVRAIYKFAQGLVLEGDAQGVAYNTFHMTWLLNAVNLLLDTVNGGWSNQNTFIGGGMSHANLGGTTPYAGTVNVKLGVVNSNTFLGCSLEGGYEEWLLDCGGAGNRFIECRWEVLAGTPPVVFRGHTGSDYTQYNTIDGGYGAGGIEPVDDAAGTNRPRYNSILDSAFSRVSGSSANGLLALQNGNTNSRAVGIYSNLGGALDQQNLTTDYQLILAAGQIVGKAKADAHPRFRFDNENGYLYFGKGTAALTQYMRAYNADTWEFNGFHWRINVDNTYDVGASSKRWRDLHLGRTIYIGGDLDHNGTKVGFYDTTAITQPTALTTVDSNTINTGDSTSDTAIENMRTRIGELESKLQALGLLA